MVFLFVSVSLLVNEQDQNENIKKKLQEIERLSKKMNNALDKEFSRDFKKWGAKRLKDGTIRFQGLKIMFFQGSYKLRPKFKKILRNFCSRYVNTLRSHFALEDIQEVRIIGHSSSEWKAKKRRKRHISNANLSLKRAFKVHKFCYDNISKRNQKKWFSGKAVTIGANYVHPVKNIKGKEKKISSRRVEFRAQLKSLSTLREYFTNVR